VLTSVRPSGPARAPRCSAGNNALVWPTLLIGPSSCRKSIVQRGDLAAFSYVRPLLWEARTGHSAEHDAKRRRARGRRTAPGRGRLAPRARLAALKVSDHDAHAARFQQAKHGVMGKRRAQAPSLSSRRRGRAHAARRDPPAQANSPEELVFAGDDAPDTLHAAVLEHGAAIAVASVMREPFPSRPSAGDWRGAGWRHASARAAARGASCSSSVSRTRAARGGTLLWCNARVPARGFYELAGFAADGDTFEIPWIGPHVLMWFALAEPR